MVPAVRHSSERGLIPLELAVDWYAQIEVYIRGFKAFQAFLKDSKIAIWNLYNQSLIYKHA